jgi:hypothetical protein
MAINPVDVFYLPPNYPPLPVPDGSFDVWGQYMDVAADGISFPCTGNDIIMVQGGAVDHVITIKTVGDQFKRTGDILYNVGAGKLVVLPKIQPIGFEQPDGTAIITGDTGSEELYFWVFDDVRKNMVWDGHAEFAYRVTVTDGEATTPQYTFGAGAPAAVVDWGDGAARSAVTSGAELSHTYTAGGTYIVKLIALDQETYLTEVDISNDYFVARATWIDLLRFKALTNVIGPWYIGYGKVGTMVITR